MYKEGDELDKEYVIKIGLTPHKHDNFAAPHHWCILIYNTTWCNECSGWSTTPEQAFYDASEAFKHMQIKTNNCS
jgi:hypothetical protein